MAGADAFVGGGEHGGRGGIGATHLNEILLVARYS
jgi:hypothetical protein